MGDSVLKNLALANLDIKINIVNEMVPKRSKKNVELNALEH